MDDARIEDAKNPSRSLYLGVSSSKFNTGTKSVYQSTGSKGYHDKNDSGFTNNKLRQDIEKEIVQPSNNSVKRSSKHPIDKYKF